MKHALEKALREMLALLVLSIGRLDSLDTQWKKMKCGAELLGEMFYKKAQNMAV